MNILTNYFIVFTLNSIKTEATGMKKHPQASWLVRVIISVRGGPGKKFKNEKVS